MAFEFKPGAPKEAEACTFAALQRKMCKIEGAKRVGGGVVKVFTDSPVNYYIKESFALQQWLYTNFKVEV